MSYVTYTTQAIVCGTYDRNTADRSYRLFTRELGMLYAEARSVRKENSKQRQALSDFASIKVSLIRGKGGWKIGSVTEIKNYYSYAVNQAARGSVVKIVRLLRRFLAGEETHVELFDEYLEALEFFSTDCLERTCYEHVFIQRILAQLGYIKSSDVPAQFKAMPLGDIPSDEVCIRDTVIALSIERAQNASQL
ncbi:MAG: recombinational DNA repair protein (RecF pathway) [Candidatus Paceibacteria bacterium]|jgi:recombinational DNA repair protein (RecF pathway)